MKSPPTNDPAPRCSCKCYPPLFETPDEFFFCNTALVFSGEASLLFRDFVSFRCCRLLLVVSPTDAPSDIIVSVDARLPAPFAISTELSLAGRRVFVPGEGQSVTDPLVGVLVGTEGVEVEGLAVLSVRFRSRG